VKRKRGRRKSISDAWTGHSERRKGYLPDDAVQGDAGINNLEKIKITLGTYPAAGRKPSPFRGL
jgi:hypothetical protein